jgi:hypothetical protein
MEGGRTPGIQRRGGGRYSSTPGVQAGRGAQRRGGIPKVQIHQVAQRAVAIVVRTAAARGATRRSATTGFLHRERKWDIENTGTVISRTMN